MESVLVYILQYVNWCTFDTCKEYVVTSCTLFDQTDVSSGEIGNLYQLSTASRSGLQPSRPVTFGLYVSAFWISLIGLLMSLSCWSSQAAQVTHLHLPVQVFHRMAKTVCFYTTFFWSRLCSPWAGFRFLHFRFFPPQHLLLPLKCICATLSCHTKGNMKVSSHGIDIGPGLDFHQKS